MSYFEEFRYRDFGIFSDKQPGWERLEETSQGWFVSQHNFTDVGMTIQRYKNPLKQDEEAFIAPFFIDMDDHSDGRSSLNEAKKVMKYLSLEFELSNEHLRVYYSGRRGFHVFIPESILGITPHQQLNKIHRKITNKIKKTLGLTCIDPHSFDRRRLVRIPSTRHSVTGLYKTELYPQELEKGINVIKKLAQKPRELYHSDLLELHLPAAEQYQAIKREVLREEPKHSISPAEIKHPCIRKIFINGPPRLNTRHDCSMVLAVYFKNQLKLSELENLNLIIEWNKVHFDMSKETNFSAVESNVKSQMRSIYKNAYKIGCKESTYAPLLKECCNLPDCSFYKSSKGTVPFDREQRYSYLWDKKEGMGSSCQRVYETMVDFSNRYRSPNSPLFKGKKAFFTSGILLGEFSSLSENIAKLKLELLIASGLIERVPQIALPRQYRRRPGRRTCDYYIVHVWNKELEKAAWQRWQKIKKNIQGTLNITKIRKVFNTDSITKQYFKDIFEKLLKEKNKVHVQDLLREGVSYNVIKKYFFEVVAEKRLTFDYDTKGKRSYHR